MKTMAEVEMDLHLLIKDLNLPLSPANRELIVKTLTSAGFGPVKASAAGALRDAADSIDEGGSVSKWLRLRADSIEGQR